MFLSSLLHHSHDGRFPASRWTVDRDRLPELLIFDSRKDGMDDVLATVKVDALRTAELSMMTDFQEEIVFTESIVGVLGLGTLDEIDGAVSYGV